MKRGSSRKMGRREESGFALLLVYVMAAAIAITFYMEVPRIAFESQRAREQMAIDRGLQYERAIQLFYRKFQTYPQTLDDLETSRNIRFLRHRYKDPLTGKDFRLLHVGPAGQLTDSLVTPLAAPPGSSPGSSFGSSTGGSFGSSTNSAQGSSQTTASAQPVDPNNPNNPNDPNAQPPDPLNMAARRPSDRIIGGRGAGGGGGAGGGIGNDAGGDQPPPQEPDPNQPQQPGQPVSFPGQPVQQPGDPNQPVTPQDPSQPQVPGQPPVPGQPNAPPAPIGFPPGLTPPSTAYPGQTPGAPTSFPQIPGVPQAPGQPTAGAAGQPQSAASMIQQILTTPRQPPASISAFTSGNTGGIAGVASTADGKGIHLVNDHSKYKQWEFVYDLKKDKTVVGAAGVNQQQQIQQQMQQNGTNGTLGSGAFGNTSGGSNSPFSSTPASSPSQSAPSAPPIPPPPQ